MSGCNPFDKFAVESLMVARIHMILFVSTVCVVFTGNLSGQCPQFLGTEIVADLPATASSPHWFECISSVTADPAPFNFELTAQPATHNGVQIDWGDGSGFEAIGSWDGTTLGSRTKPTRSTGLPRCERRAEAT